MTNVISGLESTLMVARRVLSVFAAGMLCLALAGCVSGETRQEDDRSDVALELDDSSQSSSSQAAASQGQGHSDDADASSENREASMFYIHVNGRALAVAPSNNSSSQALLDLLAKGDVIVAAHDYGNFEKVGRLPQSLPANDEQITTEAGDVILYQGDQITVYYDTNSWNFTRLGKIEGVDAADLREILGGGDVELRLSLE